MAFKAVSRGITVTSLSRLHILEIFGDVCHEKVHGWFQHTIA